MDNLLAFLEGIITFISPCLLPLLPVYISFFAGSGQPANNAPPPHTNPAMGRFFPGNRKSRPLPGALGFCLGFTAVFVSMGAAAGSIGRLLNTHQTAVNIVGGLIVILFGLSFLGVINIPFLNRTAGKALAPGGGLLKTILFGAVFAVSWTPCVGAFLGSALMLAGTSGSVFAGVVMLLCFSAGLAIPFIVSALLIDKLKGAFSFIKKHYGVINSISGCFLILVGGLMMTGTLRLLMNFMSRFAI